MDTLTVAQLIKEFLVLERLLWRRGQDPAAIDVFYEKVPLKRLELVKVGEGFCIIFHGE